MIWFMYNVLVLNKIFFSFHKWNEDLTICEPDVCNFFVDKIKKKHISCRKVLSKNSKHFLVVYFVNVLRS